MTVDSLPTFVSVIKPSPANDDYERPAEIDPVWRGTVHMLDYACVSSWVLKWPGGRYAAGLENKPTIGSPGDDLPGPVGR
jgi:hypothetical protein